MSHKKKLNFSKPIPFLSAYVSMYIRNGNSYQQKHFDHLLIQLIPMLGNYKMQSERNPDAPTGGGCRSQAKGSNCGHRKARSNTPPLLRRQPTCLCSPSNHPGSFRCSQHRSAAVSERPRRQPIGDREIVKRALSPPLRRCPSRHHRRWNFRSTPSRLCNMSMD